MTSLLKIGSWLSLFVRGLCMGIADLVPGVSGGTVAFALGIHPDLLRALKTLKLSAIKHPKSVAWFLLSAILCGVLTSLALGSHLIYYLLNQPVYQSLLRALFLGLIVGSILYCIKKVGSWSFTRALSLVFGVLIALSISVFNLKFTETNSYSVPMQLDLQSTSSNGFINYDDQSKQLTDVSLSHVKALLKDGYIEPNTWIYNQQFEKYVQVESCMDFATNQYFDFKLILCGALAICAMLLPGISGSQVMQMFGSYELIIEAITLWTKQLSTGSFINPSFWVLFNVGLGILLGIATFSRFFIFLYRKYYYATLSLLVGFMFGSLPTLWPFWSLSYRVHMSQSGARLVLERLNPLLPNVLTPQTWLVFLMISLGISILLLLERIEAKKQDIDLVA